MEQYEKKMIGLAYMVERRGIELLATLNRVPDLSDEQEEHMADLWVRDAKAIALELVRSATIAIDAKDLKAGWIRTPRFAENSPHNVSAQDAPTSGCDPFELPF